MGSHQDLDHIDEQRREFLKDLGRRAEIMTDLGKNELQHGKAIRQWKHEGVTVQQLDEDMNGVLRISIGGGSHLPVPGDYCNYRGDQSRCIRLLERALEAMKAE